MASQDVSMKPEHSSTAPDPRADKVDPNTTILGPNPDIFELRVQLAYSMAKRISNGASLEQVAFQNNMTVDQLGRMISVLATQSVQVNRALGMDLHTLLTILAENEEENGLGKAIEEGVKEHFLEVKARLDTASAEERRGNSVEEDMA